MGQQEGPQAPRAGDPGCYNASADSPGRSACTAGKLQGEKQGGQQKQPKQPGQQQGQQKQQEQLQPSKTVLQPRSFAMSMQPSTFAEEEFELYCRYTGMCVLPDYCFRALQRNLCLPTCT